MTQNVLVLSGVVVEAAQHLKSPAGIEHCQFSIEHRSMQNEANLNRQAFVKMQVVATGEWSQHLTRELTEGREVNVSGFINCHESRNGNAIVVLHAQQIEMIN